MRIQGGWGGGVREWEVWGQDTRVSPWEGEIEETSWFDLGQVDMRDSAGGRWRGTVLKEKTGKGIRKLGRSPTQGNCPQVYKDGPS